MPSTAIDIALLVALVFTCGFSFAMLREFRHFKAYASEYGLALHDASQAMERVDAALARTHDEGARTAITLGERLDAAQCTLDALKATETAASAQLLRLRERIHEARDAAARAESAIRAPDDPQGDANAGPDAEGHAQARSWTQSKATAAGRRKGGGSKSGDGNAAGDKSAGGKSAGGKTLRKSRAGTAPEPAEAEAAAMAIHHNEAAEPATVTENRGTLALAPAEKAARNAPRTRKILSWPVIRSTGIAAGT
ncbi:hypothetical protein [Saliniramus sp.]|uniref:hypothetical protein n=1 Tax=Saliniramus sp. TaxID=2986772 RepID=UPI002CC5918A|nr:hypothetical protein [Saliniramus sp.]HMB10616.1 hypothetical protein [Saliniramus sp.]